MTLPCWQYLSSRYLKLTYIHAIISWYFTNFRRNESWDILVANMHLLGVFPSPAQTFVQYQLLIDYSAVQL